MSQDKYSQIAKLIYGAGGRFCSATFVKKDGSLRHMQIQPAAIKNYLVGEDASESAKRAVQTRKANNPNLLPVLDCSIKEIRVINMDTIQEVVVDKVTYKF